MSQVSALVAILGLTGALVGALGLAAYGVLPGDWFFLIFQVFLAMITGLCAGFMIAKPMGEGLFSRLNQHRRYLTASMCILVSLALFISVIADLVRMTR